jgi:chromosome segregation ATPase
MLRVIPRRGPYIPEGGDVMQLPYDGRKPEPPYDCPSCADRDAQLDRLGDELAEAHLEIAKLRTATRRVVEKLDELRATVKGADDADRKLEYLLEEVAGMEGAVVSVPTAKLLWQENQKLKATIDTLTTERDALAAAMPSEGADAALAYAAMKTERDALDRALTQCRGLLKQEVEDVVPLRQKVAALQSATRKVVEAAQQVVDVAFRCSMDTDAIHNLRDVLADPVIVALGRE